MTGPNTLGEYLRARRELVEPGARRPARGRRPPDPRACAARRSPRWPASAPTTTSASSRAATATRRRRCSRRWRGCSASTRPRPSYLLSLAAAARRRRPGRGRPRQETVPGRHPAAHRRRQPAGVRGEPDVRRARRQPARDRALAVHPAGGEPAPLDVPRPGRARAVSRLAEGHRRHDRLLPRLDRPRRRRPAHRPAGRRALAGQRAVQEAVGAARRAGSGGRRRDDEPPRGRARSSSGGRSSRSATPAASCW